MITPIVSKRFGITDSHKIETALEHGVYGSLEKVFKSDPKTLIDTVEASGLRGKGGGGAPAGKK